MSEPRVVLTGASSQIGVFALPRLLAQGWRVTAVSRRGRPAWCPGWDAVEWIGPDQAPADPPWALLSAGPLDVALHWLRTQPTIRRAAVTSTSSVVAKADSPDPAERQLVAALGAREQALRQTCAKRGVPLVLLRPTLIYGCGLDRNLSRLAAFIRRFGFCPVSTRAHGRRQPLHADDLAAALTAGLAVDPATLGGAALVEPLAGGSTLTYRAMLERLFPALDRPVRVLPLPPALLAAVITTRGKLTPGNRASLSPAMVERQRVHLAFDDRRARQILRVAPRAFHPGAEDFRLPETNRLQALAEPVTQSLVLK